MSFDVQGYLSDDTNILRLEKRQKFTRYFAIIESINVFCQNIKYQLEIDSEDGQKIVSMAMFIKFLNDLQGAALLLERGLTSPARSMIRVGLETLFILANTSQDKEFFISYVESDQVKRLKLLRVMQGSTAAVFDEVRPKIKGELIDQLTQEVKEKGITEDSAEKMAIRCGLKPFYDSMYRLFSQDVHSAPKVIEAFCQFDTENKLIGFFHGYEKENIMSELTTIPRLMYLGVFAINKLFNLGIDRELVKFDEQIRSLESPPSS